MGRDGDGVEAHGFEHVADAGVAYYQKTGPLEGRQDAEDEE